MMAESLSALGQHIANQSIGAVQEWNVTYDELTAIVDGKQIISFMQFLREDKQCHFRQLIDICGADYPQRERRFDVVYHLLSLKHNQRIRVKVQTDENTPIDSIVSVFPNAGWYEREAWDMYGIFFSNNPDLRRILTDYGFDGHPLRKDFPMTGYVEMRYDETEKRVVYEPIKLQQEFRSFDFMSPWEGAQYPLPGDEKADDKKGAA